MDKKSTFIGYGILASALALGSLWIGFYNDIRRIIGSILPAVLNIDSRWWVSRGPIVIVVAYLVVTLIWTMVKVALIEKGKRV